ncbi:LLM class flavin-dependent oxidoreductase [Flavobacterium sp. KS-LB2]|uniref:LLM class flavin-dependent oxidoreductase n=1 Tax=Flavobacterium sp. KS-LB2 TaxID=3120525 RepID=UPI0030D0EC83
MKLSSLIFDSAQSNNLLDLFTMAEMADRCGFERFWIGEHYEQKNLWNNPEPLIPIILGLTERINVGAAGILLKLHSPFRVASSFKLLNTIFPDRVDLGFAAGYASREIIDSLLGQNSSLKEPKDFFELIQEIDSFYTKEAENNDGILLNPNYKLNPRLWLLSTGFNRYEESIMYGLNYSKSMFHSGANNDFLLEELKIYKERFYKKHNKLPIINLAFSGILTQNSRETKKMKEKINDLSRFRFIKPNLIGTSQLFQDKIMEYRDKYDIDDFTFLDLSYEMTQRIENVENLSEVFKLRQAP